MRFLCLLVLTSIMSAGALLAFTMPQGKSDEIVFREALVIPPVGRGGRSAIHTDAIEHQIVMGKWKAPKAGDEVRLPDGATRKWEALKAGEDGWFNHRALVGGYAFCSVASDAKKVMILDASGHSMVYVNGEPRVGDPHQTGYVRLPVELKKGENEFLFQGGRGRVRAKLRPPRAIAQLDTGDLTLPDVVVGEALDARGAIIVLNNSTERLDKAVLRITVGQGKDVSSTVWPVPPLTLRKVGFPVQVPAQDAPGELPVVVKLFASDSTEKSLDVAEFKLRVVARSAPRKITFKSSIDGSIQYYALTPMANSTLKADEKPALFLTLHGAGVEALGQVSCYANKTWGHVVAPTNRRPYGFDWEDWGRLDAMEVLELAQRSLGTDPRRTYLTGHSMGGHGVWQLGALYPDRFAAIAPSAGWISMYSYAGARRPENPDPRVEMLLRAASTSDTLAMVKNYAQMGVYVLHGEKDDNVPVGQAREMRKQLASFHSDFVYYERPGAGHWWGNECVDWPPIFEFFARHIKPEAKDVRQVEFTTLNPSVSCWSAYPCVPVAQVQALRPSLLRLSREPAKNTVHLTTENVALLTVITRHLELKEPVTLQIDANKFVGGEETLAEIELFRRDGGNWKRGDTVSHTERSFLRNGPFKDAFRERMVFVHGTRGMPEEQAWMYAKARYDSEVFWYRGNGSVDVLPDTRINPGSVEGRSVILYGNSATNSAWDRLLKESQVQVASGGVKVGKEIVKGDNLTCLFIQPKSGLVSSYIAAVSGTGLAGMRLTERIPYFVSGVGIPDLLVLDPTMLEKGEDGIVVSGFFGNDWSVDKGEFAWRK